MMWWCDGDDDDDDHYHDHYHDHDDCKCGAKFGLGRTCFVRMCGACHFEVQAAATDLPKHTRYDLIRLDPIRSEDTRNLQTPNGREKPFSALSAKPLHSVHQTHNDIYIMLDPHHWSDCRDSSSWNSSGNSNRAPWTCWTCWTCPKPSKVTSNDLRDLWNPEGPRVWTKVSMGLKFNTETHTDRKNSGHISCRSVSFRRSGEQLA